MIDTDSRSYCHLLPDVFFGENLTGDQDVIDGAIGGVLALYTEGRAGISFRASLFVCRVEQFFAPLTGQNQGAVGHHKK